MPADHIRYDILVQDALRAMVRDLLTDVAKNGLPSDHHFFITFDTTAEGVRLSDRVREQYPEEMTIVLQHQFWDLKVTDKAFEVGLSFGGVAERLHVPLAAIKGFADPSVQFALQFEELALAADDGDESKPAASPAAPQPPAKSRMPARPSRTSVPASRPAPSPPLPAAAAEPPDKPAGDKSGAEVVRLDRFRKK